jgi:hypothetical protein
MKSNCIENAYIKFSVLENQGNLCWRREIFLKILYIFALVIHYEEF